MCLVTYSRLDKYSSLVKLEKFKKIEKLESPLWGHIEICGSCSHKCPWCYASYFSKTKEHMSLDTLRNVLDKMSKIGVIQITITGGEPLEHPQFKEIVEMIDDYGFIFHLNTNGDGLDNDLLDFLKNHQLKQISFNFQGSKWHDKLHSSKCFENLKQTILNTKLFGIEVVANVVIGGYNINDLEEIFKEAVDLEVDRLRSWDVLNSSKHLQSINIKDMFIVSENIAKSFGYNHTISYDPLINGDIHVKCISGSGLYIHIKSNGKRVWCPALDNVNEIDDWANNSIEESAQKYKFYNDNMDYCKDCLVRVKNFQEK